MFHRSFKNMTVLYFKHVFSACIYVTFLAFKKYFDFIIYIYTLYVYKTSNIT